MGTNTGVGIGIGIPFKNNALGGDRPYLPPELKARLIGVWDNYGKKNTDADRNIIKNKIPNAGGDLEILNAAYKLNSGFGKYKEDFTSWRIYPNIEVTDNVITTNGNFNLTWFIYKHSSESKINEMNIKVSGIPKGGKILYFYISDETANLPIAYTIPKDGIYHLPESKINNNRISVGFTVESRYDWNNIRIEQIPSFEGAFVTDGINDLITSTKTVQEMLGGSNEITVVSMMANLDSRQILCNSNFSNTNGYNVRNTLEPNGVISMLGYTDKNGTTNNLNLIMGDKDSIKLTDKVNFNSDYVFYPAQYYKSYYQVAWYWTIIANKVLTTDQINQVIAYFNLDRTLKPDILCNITKQGITNDNHADFNDKLVDYSGNGRDIQMNNLAWKGGSGIAAKQYETFKDWLSESSSTSIIKQIDEFTRIVESTTNGYWVSRIIRDSDLDKVYDPINVYLYQDNNFLIHECKYEVDGVKYSIPIYESVGKGYHKLEIYTKDRYTELPENAEKVVLSEWYFPKSNKGSIKYSLIPSYKGGILLDGVNDFGKVTGMPVYKDYTIVVDYERISGREEALISKAYIVNQGAFVLMETSGTAKHSYSFGAYTAFNRDDFTRTLLYQSKYKCGDVNLIVGEGIDGDTLWLGTLRDNDYRFFNGAIYSLMSFPYSMSEFLIERQLKKHKLGTLYPDMVEFRPVIKTNVDYKITYYQIDSTNTWKSIKVGDYIVIGAKLAFQITFDNDASELKEVVSPQLSGIIVEKRPSNPGYNIYSYITSKSPQKINITIDEYIRYEDIVQPYPVLLRFNDENGNEVSWGGKFKVGSTITRIGSIADPESNLLNGLYSISGLSLNGKSVTSSTSIVEKQMVFKTTATYLFDNNEPKCILSPSRLRIPNSSYKILGYIPDISGHGNHGVIHNSAYAEGSGVNEDGSYQFDGVDDFVTIPTTVGGKQVLMKVNWQSYAGAVTLYDQRLNLPDYEFAIYNGDRDLDDNPIPAYQGRNNGQTYIDGILNNNIKASELRHITHNITITNELSLGTNNTYPVIGSTRSNTHFAQMSLYDFMLFDNISTDDKIKELNEYVGIEAKVELPPYYWDAYGKTNLDADKATIQQRGVAVGDYDLTNNNHAYDKMSGYGGYKFAKFDNTIEWFAEDSSMVVNRNGYLITLKKVPNVAFWRFRNTTLKSLDNPLTFKVKCNKPIDVIFQVKFAKNNDVSIGYNYNIKEVTLVPNESTTIIVPSVSVSDIPEATSILFINVLFNNTSLSDNEEYTVEMLPLYPNGLVYDAITDYSENVNIPVFTDFTAIMKRKWLKNQGCPLIKGSKVYEGGNGNALLFEWDKAYNFVFYKRTDIMEGEVPENISFITPTNYNGNVITRGSEQDTNGICIAGDGNAGFANMVFYKLILYPKTIPLLQINFLKNLMEKDEIIDLNNPIFIKNE